MYMRESYKKEYKRYSLKDLCLMVGFKSDGSHDDGH